MTTTHTVPGERYPTNATAFSFVGGTKRLLRYTYSWRKLPVIGWAGIALILPVAWTLILCWYAVLTAGFFIVVPWRIVRRQQRNTKRMQAQQVALLSQMAHTNGDR